MTVRVLILTVLVAAGVLLGMGTAIASFAPALLSEHSRPASKHFDGRKVAVVKGGKTFHDPKCTYMHGKPEMIGAEEAIKKGYAPCVRCMREALKEK